MSGPVREDAPAAAPLVKICGIREEATLRGMNGLPVDYIGFVFAPSRRRVTAAQAARLAAEARRTRMAGGLPPRIAGVFVDPSPEEIAAVMAEVRLDVVQLHGSESPELCREVAERFGVEVWRALPVDEPGDGAEAGAGGGKESASARAPAPASGEAWRGGAEPAGPDRLDAYRGAVSAVLLDTAGGGTGRPFRWDLIPAYRKKAADNGLKLFVAGGLTPDNVKDLLATGLPDGVDISSGVETDGAKDNDKIAAFAERVKL